MRERVRDAGAVEWRSRLSGEETFYRADGTAFPVEFNAAPVIEGGRLTGTV